VLPCTDGKDIESGKLRLWNVIDDTGSTVQSNLKLMIIVDNSMVEIYANDVTVITTRVYPWLLASRGAGILVKDGGLGSYASYEDVELWDGLIDAWPSRTNYVTSPINGL
jgi:beta-fructofuranosidase